MMQTSSRQWRDKLTSEGGQPAKFCTMNAMVVISDGKMAPFPGGILLKTADGKVLGAVGVSGGTDDEDEYCALVAI